MSLHPSFKSVVMLLIPLVASGCDACDKRTYNDAGQVVSPADVSIEDVRPDDTSYEPSDTSDALVEDVEYLDTRDADVEAWWESLPPSSCAPDSLRVPPEPYRPPVGDVGNTSATHIWEAIGVCEHPERGPGTFGVSKWQIGYDEFPNGPAVVGMTAAREPDTLPETAGRIAFIDPETGAEKFCSGLPPVFRAAAYTTLTTLGPLDRVATVHATLPDNHLPVDELEGRGMWSIHTRGLDDSLSEFRLPGMVENSIAPLHTIVTSRGEQIFIRDGRLVAVDVFTHEYLWSAHNISHRWGFTTMAASSDEHVWAVARDWDEVNFTSTLYQLDNCGVATERFVSGRELSTPIELRERFVVEHSPSRTDTFPYFVRIFDRSWNQIGSDIPCQNPVTLDDEHFACLALDRLTSPTGVLKVIDSAGDIISETKLDFSADTYGIAPWSLVAAANNQVLFTKDSLDGGLQVILVQLEDGTVSVLMDFPIILASTSEIRPVLLTPSGLLIVPQFDRLYGIQTNIKGLSKSKHPRGVMGGNANRGWVEVLD